MVPVLVVVPLVVVVPVPVLVPPEVVVVVVSVVELVETVGDVDVIVVDDGGVLVDDVTIGIPAPVDPFPVAGAFAECLRCAGCFAPTRETAAGAETAAAWP